MDPAAFAGVAHALGRLRYKPRGAWIEAFLDASRPRLAAMSPVELSQAVRGMALLGFLPDGDWLGALLAATARAMQDGSLRGAQMANVAWALGLLKVKGWGGVAGGQHRHGGQVH